MKLISKKRISPKDMASTSKSVIHHHNINIVIDVDKYEDAKSDIHNHNIIDLDRYEDVDDFYISSALYDEDEVLLISAEKYAQVTLISSSASKRNASSSSQKMKVGSSSSSTPPNKLKRKQPMLTSEEEEAAAKVATSFCGICMDTKSLSEMFSNKKVCTHLFCSDCIGQHVSVKIKENIAKVKCPQPKCKGVIRPELCRSIVPKEVLERWEDALCESLILGKQKFYCPFQDCSAMLVNDSGKAVTSSECPNCNRLFCAQCKVAWHSGLDCREYKSLKEYERNPEDMMLMELAKNKQWKRCPSCNFVVEKRDGCNLISCRCGHHFCYRCGRKHRNYGYCDSGCGKKHRKGSYFC